VIGKGLLGGAWDASGPAWSPDGSLVAYNAVEGIPDREWFRVHVVGADGTGDRALSLSAYPVSEGWPAWSPDGKKLVVQRWAGDGDARIAILGLDDQRAPASLGPRHSFVDNEAWVAIWSPDGKRLLVRWDDAADQVRDSYLLDPVTGAYTPIDWPLTDHPSWQRLAP
jgi:dipeptidyl aminopeptidase/acylaminoacyl peptidase